MSAALVVARCVGVLGAMWLGVAVGVLVDGNASGLLGLGAGCVAFAVVLGVTEPSALQVVKHAPESQSGPGPGGAV